MRALSPRQRLGAGALIGGLALAAVVLLVAAFMAPFADGGPGGPSAIALQISTLVTVWLAVAGVCWLVLRWLLIAPVGRLAGEARALAEAPGRDRLDAAAFPWLSPLPEAINALADRLATNRAEIERAVAATAERAEEQKGRLEALLRDLTEGVIVCNLEHQVLLYNQTVIRILGGPSEFGLGRSLFSFLTREPVLHALDRLTQPAGGGERAQAANLAFVCATADARALLQGRMSLIAGESGDATGYVLTLADATSDIAALGKRDALLRAAIEGVRAPIANVRAAAETLAAHPTMPDEQRRAFENIVVNESTQLSERLADLTDQYRGLIGGYGAMGDLHSADLINCVIRRLRDVPELALTMTGRPAWLHGDSYALMLMLAGLIVRLHEHLGARQFDIEARAGDRRVYLDIVWPGEPLSSALLSNWLDATLEGSLGGLTIRNVLDRHHSDLWSEPHGSGGARLVVPLPAAVEAAGTADEPLPSRAEFYDFDLLAWPGLSPELGDRPLGTLTYVVFDTETTGLRPGEDEVVSLAGVRIVNGRLLTGETFNRLVNPRRPIPATSTRFHRITDAMVRDKPPIEVVLPQFKAFAADAVLVAHNIAFDLTFLKAKEAGCGVSLDNPILDTMLLSATLHEHTDDHTIERLARRYGVEVQGRHTALGDAMTTAAVLLAMFETLERRGIHTLDQAVRASRVVLELRARQARLAATAGR